MKWSSFVERVAVRSGASPRLVRAVVAGCAEELAGCLDADERIRIPGVGTFSRRWRDGGVARSFKEGRKVAYDGRFSVRFTPTAPLIRRLNIHVVRYLKDPEHQAAYRLAEAMIGDIELYHSTDIPKTLERSATAGEVDDICSVSLGVTWARVRSSYELRVPTRVLQERDHLSLAARRHWAGR